MLNGIVSTGGFFERPSSWNDICCSRRAEESGGDGRSREYDCMLNAENRPALEMASQQVVQIVGRKLDTYEDSIGVNLLVPATYHPVAVLLHNLCHI